MVNPHLRWFTCSLRLLKLDITKEKHVLNVAQVHDLPLHHTVKLSSQTYKGKTPADPAKTPLILLHGLFGAKQNYNSVGRNIATATGRHVIGLDLRNHGTSPHAAPHDYSHLTQDVIAHIDSMKSPVILAGHLMGAKVAMLVSLLRPDLVEKLVVIDNSPVSEKLGIEFDNDLVGMCHVERDKSLRNLPPKALLPKVDAVLSKYEKNSLVRLFLMSNLSRRQSKFDPLPVKFRVPVLNFLKHDTLAKLGDWPEMDGKKYNGPVLVMRGLDSHFVTDTHIEYFHRYFGDVSVVTFDSGHWLVSEQPDRFVDEMIAFTEGKNGDDGP